MHKIYLTFLTAIFFFTASAHIYQIDYLEGSMPGKNPIKVFILYDNHTYNLRNREQQLEFVRSVRHFNGDSSLVLVEDHNHYFGTSPCVIKEVKKSSAEQEKTPQFLRGLTQCCMRANIPVKNLDNYRFERLDKSMLTDCVTEYETALDTVSRYSDGPLNDIYQDHLDEPYFNNKEFRRKLHADAKRSRFKETTIFEAFHEIYVTNELSKHRLISRKTYDENKAPRHILQILEERRDAAQKKYCTYLGLEILDIKALHKLYNLPDAINTVFICAGDIHAHNISKMITKKLGFIRCFRRGDVEIKEEPLDIRLFFDHYIGNMRLQTNC